MFASSTIKTFYPWFVQRGGPDPVEMLGQAQFVLIDNVKPGELLRVIWHLPGDSMVFAADQDSLLKSPSSWLNSLPSGSLYVSHPSHGNTLGGEQEIVGLISQYHEIRLFHQGIWRLDHFFEIF